MKSTSTLLDLTKKLHHKTKAMAVKTKGNALLMLSARAAHTEPEYLSASMRIRAQRIASQEIIPSIIRR